MRIVTWNCNGAFRKKYSRLKIDDKYPDILVIQECENPKVYSCQTYVTKIVKIKTLLSFWILIFLYTPVLID